MLAFVLTVILFVLGAWLIVLVLCSLRFVQRQIYYAHNIPIWWGQNLEIPESLGYLKNQVSIHILETTDGERLFAWLVVPLGAYLRDEKQFTEVNTGREAAEKGLNCIRTDAESKLLIYFHGNAGSVGQTRRTEAYRSITACDTEHAYVFTFDYRGFCRSTGTPTEEGMTQDALAVIKWATETARVPSRRIFLLGQSIGTAVATTALSKLTNQSPPPEFGGLVLCAPFTEAAEVFINYAPFGRVAVLAPLNLMPWLRRWLVARIQDKWPTIDHISALISTSQHLRLTLIHATNDETISSKTTELIAAHARKLLQDEGIASSIKIDLDEGGSWEEYRTDRKIVRKVILKYGGHNTTMKWAPVALEIARLIKESSS